LSFADGADQLLEALNVDHDTVLGLRRPWSDRRL